MKILVLEGSPHTNSSVSATYPDPWKKRAKDQRKRAIAITGNPDFFNPESYPEYIIGKIHPLKGNVIFYFVPYAEIEEREITEMVDCRTDELKVYNREICQKWQAYVSANRK